MFYFLQRPRSEKKYLPDNFVDWMSKLVQVLSGAWVDSRQNVIDYLMSHRKKPQPGTWDMRNPRYGLTEEEVQEYMKLAKVRSTCC